MGIQLCAVLFLGATLAVAESGSVLLLSDCSDASPVKRVIQSSDVVEVRHSLIGESQSCYAVSIMAENGSVVDGFILGAQHPAVIRFERQEQTYIAQSFSLGAETRDSRAKRSARAKQSGHRSWNRFSTE